MRIGSLIIKRRVALTAVAIVATVSGSLLWMRFPTGGALRENKQLSPTLLVAGSGERELLGVEANLLDPSPLFFPTDRNYGQDRMATAFRRQPDEGFRNFEPQFRFSEQQLKTYGREAVTVPEKLSDVLEQGETALFPGFGEIDHAGQALAERSGFMEVKSFESGNLYIQLELHGLKFSTGDFAPVEFLVTVGRGGLVGEPLLAANSGSDAVDGFAREYLSRDSHLGERLPPGKYLVSIGP